MKNPWIFLLPNWPLYYPIVLSIIKIRTNSWFFFYQIGELFCTMKTSFHGWLDHFLLWNRLVGSWMGLVWHDCCLQNMGFLRIVLYSIKYFCYWIECYSPTCQECMYMCVCVCARALYSPLFFLFFIIYYVMCLTRFLYDEIVTSGYAWKYECFILYLLLNEKKSSFKSQMCIIRKLYK